jgi:hypothetical protein
MARYRISGAILESPIPLLELPLTPAGDPDLTLEIRRYPPSPASGPWYRQWRGQDEKVWLSFGRRGSDYVLQFPELADFVVTPAGTITCYGLDTTASETFSHFLLDIVLPFALSARGKIVLHASAVRSSAGAILFLGQGGQGKSTLAAGFAQEGMAILADDAVVLEEEGTQAFALPSYPGIRLWEDVSGTLFGDDVAHSNVAHYTAKKRIDPSRGTERIAGGRIAVSRGYILTPPIDQESVQITPIPAKEACVEILGHAYCMDPANRKSMAWSLEQAGRLATKIPFYRLAYPRLLPHLPLVRQAILDRV